MPSTNYFLVSYKTYPMFTGRNALRYKLENFSPLYVNLAHQKDLKTPEIYDYFIFPCGFRVPTYFLQNIVDFST